MSHRERLYFAAPVGVVLAGGASRRMGRDKALLEWEGGSLISRACEALAAVCTQVAVADRGRGYQPRYPSLQDGPGRGPAAGLLGAANAFPGRSILALACDLPLVPSALLRWLAFEPALDVDVCLPVWDRGREPLCSLLRPRALAVLESRVNAGTYDLRTLADSDTLHPLFLTDAALEAFGTPSTMFANVNEPDQWLTLKGADLEAKL